MKTLVLVEHDNRQRQGRHACGRDRRRRSWAKSICWSPARAAAPLPTPRAKIAGVGKVHVADDAAYGHAAAGECRAARSSS